MIEVSDESLALRVRQGDRGAFDVLVRRHWTPLVQAARGFGIPETDVEDVVQDSFIAAWKAFDEFDTSRPFRAWLLGIGLNKMRDLYRFRKVRKFFFGALDISDDEVGGIADDRAGPERLAAHRQELRKVSDTLDQLDRPLREVLILTALVGLTQAEAAEALGVSLKTVEGRVIRARKRLEAVIQRI